MYAEGDRAGEAEGREMNWIKITLTIIGVISVYAAGKHAIECGLCLRGAAGALGGLLACRWAMAERGVR